MATIKSIGSSGTRDFLTIGAWLTGFAPGGWIGECYNDTEFNETVSFSGQSTSVANFITLRTASGQGFKDNANAQTNALAYNQANGVAWKLNASYGGPCVIAEDFVTLQGLQIQQVHASGNQAIANNTVGTANCVIDGLLIEQLSTRSDGIRWIGGVARNVIVIQRSSGAHGAFSCVGNASLVFVNCTAVRPSTFTVGSTGFLNSSGTTAGTVLKNCASFGFSAFTSIPTPTASNNASDQTISVGTSNQASLTYASQFQAVTDTGRDFRLATGSALVDNGVTDSTDLPAAVDIVGTSRPQGSGWDIGVWELVASSGITGSGAWTEAQGTFAGTGGVVIGGSAAWTEIQDSLAASGSIASGVVGSGAWTEANDALAAVGGVVVGGSVAFVEIRDSLAASGSVTLPGITASAAWIELIDSLVASGGQAGWKPQSPSSVTWALEGETDVIWTEQSSQAPN